MNQVKIGSKTLLPGTLIQVAVPLRFEGKFMYLWRKPTGEVMFTSTYKFTDYKGAYNHAHWLEDEETAETGYIVATDVETVEQANDIIQAAKDVVCIDVRRCS